jgi:excisionase family DNA binding protein
MSKERLLTPEQAAERLQISPYTFKDWLKKGKFPGVKVGNRWRARESDIDSYIWRQKTEKKGGEEEE